MRDESITANSSIGMLFDNCKTTVKHHSELVDHDKVIFNFCRLKKDKRGVKPNHLRLDDLGLLLVNTWTVVWMAECIDWAEERHSLIPFTMIIMKIQTPLLIGWIEGLLYSEWCLKLQTGSKHWDSEWQSGVSQGVVSWNAFIKHINQTKNTGSDLFHSNKKEKASLLQILVPWLVVNYVIL